MNHVAAYVFSLMRPCVRAGRAAGRQEGSPQRAIKRTVSDD
eukprot:CAMPEP_0205860506 /NCGR_PEP_ID=MMETSP1083-20121108/5270_1 /ASSEMBLY_ACC=CAM_ASM_000430 /TAXON_ID=97485 /ORGANISM="Prymnesium parvum, Strain Texoma1" /LENGTH=40 /DNA_ID= /DNA_START= /DNA_END= /DNA_ORIENTATION=